MKIHERNDIVCPINKYTSIRKIAVVYRKSSCLLKHCMASYFVRRAKTSKTPIECGGCGQFEEQLETTCVHWTNEEERKRKKWRNKLLGRGNVLNAAWAASWANVNTIMNIVSLSA